ncbi:hypothetical protein [Spirosoma jeollabukense]
MSVDQKKQLEQQLWNIANNQATYQLYFRLTYVVTLFCINIGTSKKAVIGSNPIGITLIINQLVQPLAGFFFLVETVVETSILVDYHQLLYEPLQAEVYLFISNIII